MAKLTLYVQAVPVFNYGTYLRSDLQLGNVTVKKPARPVANAKVVKVVLNIPDSVFKEEVPVVTLDVPAESVSGITGSIGDAGIVGVAE
jgi:hypothetical protein